MVSKPRADCTKGEQLVVTFTAGYIAGVFCAFVSHPADVVVSKLNQAKRSSAIEVAKKLGFLGMWNGLVPSIIMIGNITKETCLFPWVLTLLLRFHFDLIFIQIYFIQKRHTDRTKMVHL